MFERNDADEPRRIARCGREDRDVGIQSCRIRRNHLRVKALEQGPDELGLPGGGRTEEGEGHAATSVRWRPRSVVDVAESISTGTSSPGVASPLKFTVVL